jgi:hypothetical protein
MSTNTDLSKISSKSTNYVTEEDEVIKFRVVVLESENDLLRDSLLECQKEVDRLNVELNLFEELKKPAKEVYDDLLRRGTPNSEGGKTVNLGATAFHNLDKILFKLGLIGDKS